MTIRTMLGEAIWGRLAPLLRPQKPRTGRSSLDHRTFIEAVLWLARTGTPWRDLPWGADELAYRLASPPAGPRSGTWGHITDALRVMAPADENARRTHRERQNL
jgi:transposase